MTKIGPRLLGNFSLAASEALVEPAGYSPPTPYVKISACRMELKVTPKSRLTTPVTPLLQCSVRSGLYKIPSTYRATVRNL